MALGASTPYTPLGVVFDVVLIVLGMGITLDARHVPSHIHSIIEIAWTRMGEQNGFSSLARIYLVVGAVPFWIVRGFLSVGLVGGGVLALVDGPH